MNFLDFVRDLDYDGDENLLVQTYVYLSKLEEGTVDPVIMAKLKAKVESLYEPYLLNPLMMGRESISSVRYLRDMLPDNRFICDFLSLLQIKAKGLCVSYGAKPGSDSPYVNGLNLDFYYDCEEYCAQHIYINYDLGQFYFDGVMDLCIKRSVGARRYRADIFCNAEGVIRLDLDFLDAFGVSCFEDFIGQVIGFPVVLD